MFTEFLVRTCNGSSFVGCKAEHAEPCTCNICGFCSVMRLGADLGCTDSPIPKSHKPLFDLNRGLASLFSFFLGGGRGRRFDI